MRASPAENSIDTRYHGAEPGSHETTTVVTPNDPTRRWYLLEDVPDHLLIFHPRRKTFRASHGGRSNGRPKETLTRKEGDKE